MANKLMASQTGKMVTVIQNRGIGEMLNPLIREIHLFDTYVAGTTHLEDNSVLDEIKIDDELTLQRENNKFDQNAILLHTEQGKKLGYIPEKDNLVFARLMDAGKLLIARIKSHELKGSFHQITIGIYLVDF